jgi:hypothetical protein
MSTALALFQAMCDVGNVMEAWRDRFPPASDDWCAATEVLGWLDAAVDLLVESEGLETDNDAND